MKICILTVVVLCYHKNKDFKSNYVVLPRCNIIPNLCLQILDKLNMYTMDSPNGCSIVCEQPMGSNIILNMFRPAILRQYYGVNQSILCSDIVSRCTYGFGSKRNNVCMDPNKFVTKPFDNNIFYIAHYLKMLLCKNSKNLN